LLNASEFVSALTETCRDSAVADIAAVLQKPPGRKVPNELKELSSWYNSLSRGQQERTVAVMRLVADSTLFGVLCVLDGVRAVESSLEKSSFRLTANKGKVSKLLAPGPELLHDIYRSHP
jgi:hypothetical protein